MNEKIYPDILLIDDYDFLENTYRVESTKNEDYKLFESLYQSIYKLSGENDIKIILLTGNNNILYLKYHNSLGIKGLVHVTSAKENILTAIEVVSNGGIYIDSQINNLISEYQKYLDNHPISNLSNRQLEILYEVSKNLKNHQIAPSLNITVDTVEKHKSNIRDILNLTSDELSSFAVKNKYEIQYLLKFSKKRVWK
ncbi:MAG: response regulator transcription factor [Ignavibacteriaceae bacterium]